METESVYIVVANNHCWGKAADLQAALKNANIYEVTTGDWFSECIGDMDDVSMGDALKTAQANWLEFGRADVKDQNNEVYEVTVYRFDPAVWEDFEVSHMDGAVSFTGYKGDEPENMTQAFNNSFFRAYYQGGRLRPRSL